LPADQSTGGDINEDAQLAESVHRVLATLTTFRQNGGPLAPERLRERLELAQWLRGELAAVETLLITEQDRVRRGAAPLAGKPPS